MKGGEDEVGRQPGKGIRDLEDENVYLGWGGGHD